MNIRLLLISTLVGCAGLAVAAEEMPAFYLRGTFASGGWQDLSYQFNRTDNHYSITLRDLDGEFKISTPDWSINYGADEISHAQVYPNTTVRGIQDGLNYRADHLTGVTISFTYEAGTREAMIRIQADGGDNPGPVVSGLSGTLPVMYINVNNDEILSKDLAHKNYFEGTYWLDLNGCEWMEDEGAESVGSAEEPLALEIKARGNYSRTGFAKKPFKLKLGKKQALLGLSKSKHFALLAHADDNRGYLRNFTGFNLGQRIELPWTPSMQPVEVVINGDYRGLYFLTESIRVEEGRINITELDDFCDDPEKISGGYLVELDNYDEDNQIRMDEKGCVPGYRDTLRITFDTPEEYSDLQKMFIRDQFTAMNDAVGDNSDDLWKYMDIDDAARYYIVREITSDLEAYHGSTYLYRDYGADQKWHFSPLWDCGNAFNGPTDDFFYNHSYFGSTWIASMRMNRTFNLKVSETWKWFMSQKFDGLYEDIENFKNHIAEAAKADHVRWGNAPLPNSDNATAVQDNSDMNSRHTYVKNHLETKIAWLATRFGNYEGSFPEPERDTTPAADLPDYVITGLVELPADNAIFDISDVRLYDLQGCRIENPTAGTVVIAVTPEGKTSKILIR